MVSIDMSYLMPSNNSTSMVILIVDNYSSFQDILSLLKSKILLPYSQNPVFVQFTKTFYIHFQINHFFLLPAIHFITYAYHPRGPNPRYQAKCFYWFHICPMCSACHAPTQFLWSTKRCTVKTKTCSCTWAQYNPLFSFLLPLSRVNILNTTSFPENICQCHSFTPMPVVTFSSPLQYYVCDCALKTSMYYSRGVDWELSIVL
jgi:hypothetical protein